MRRKTQKKAEFLTLPASLPENPRWKGQWREQLGGPIVLELGCGRAEFGLQLARMYPQNRIVGIDVKSDRLWYAARQAHEAGITNIRLLHLDIFLLSEVFAPDEITCIWITFPDPYPKKAHAKRRLTGHYFLDIYQQMLGPGGTVKFKTDNTELFDFTRTVLDERRHRMLALTYDLHASAYLDAETGILTRYETGFLAEGRKTHYMHFALDF